MNIFEILYKQVWENKEDVRSFIDAYNQFLNVIFSREIILNDHNDLFKNMIKRVIKNKILLKRKFDLKCINFY